MRFLSIILFAMGVFVIAFSFQHMLTHPGQENQREWIEANIKENYTVYDSVVEFDAGVPDRDDEHTRFFTIEGRTDDHQKFTTEGYLDFDAQVVIIGDDANGAVVPIDGSEAARVLDTNGKNGS